MSARQTTPQSLGQLIAGDGTPRRAFLVALVVGTLLTAINQGDLMWTGGGWNLWKVALTYLVPYCVATWGEVTGKRALSRRGREPAGDD